MHVVARDTQDMGRRFIMGFSLIVVSVSQRKIKRPVGWSSSGVEACVRRAGLRDVFSMVKQAPALSLVTY